MEREGYPWLRRAARRMADLYDLYRVDHVVGLYRTYYSPERRQRAPRFVPPDEPAQTRERRGACSRILSQGARVIAEDLGTVPDFVRASLEGLQIPGYRVQRWEKNWEAGGNAFRDPARWPAVSVATTGTHDTDSVADWYDGLDDAERRQLLAPPSSLALRDRAGVLPGPAVEPLARACPRRRSGAAADVRWPGRCRSATRFATRCSG